MALNVGENFKQRWLNTPNAVRQTFCDELIHISALLDAETSVAAWQQQDILLQHQHRKQIKQAYEQLKQQLLAEQARQLEEQKRQHQAALEAKIEHARQLERERIERLRWEEHQQKLHELQKLEEISAQLKTELKQYSTAEIAHFDTRFAKQFNQTRLSLDDIQLRLEIESDGMIDRLLADFRIQLKQAAQEEIDLLIEGYRQKLQQDLPQSTGS